LKLAATVLNGLEVSSRLARVCAPETAALARPSPCTRTTRFIVPLGNNRSSARGRT
jgi:hypothetical protein